MRITILTGSYAVAKLSPSAEVPDWAASSLFSSVTRTADELSIVCQSERVPEGVSLEDDWRILKVEGPLDFSLTGILSKLLKPLADAKISVFTISTYDTDYILVRETNLDAAKIALTSLDVSIG